MGQLTVIRPREVTVYECDCGCGEVCDAADGEYTLPDYPIDITNPVDIGTTRMGCGWIPIPKATRALKWINPPVEAWYFSSWDCVARWAATRASAERTIAA